MMTAPRLLRAVLATVATTAALVALPSAPAFACSCSDGDTRTFAERADLVLVGTITARDAALDGFLGGESTVTYTVEVDRVYEGSATSASAIQSSGSGASCGLEVEVGTRYLVFAERQEDGTHVANLCGGTTPASDRSVSQVEEILGAGRPPAPGGPPDPGTRWDWLAAVIQRLLGDLLG